MGSRLARPRLRALTQRPEYTSRHNATMGRHGWLRIAHAYSVALVDELLGAATRDKTVLDPFGGTGTTALLAATEGHRAISLDINPFLIWLARAKFAVYTPTDLQEAAEWQRAILARTRAKNGALLPAPPLRNIDRWWSPKDIEYLRRLKTGIREADCGDRARDLLLVAFCRVVIERANLTRGHQSLSLRKRGPMQFALPLAGDPFSAAMTLVLNSAGQNPSGRATARRCDARTLSGIRTGTVDVVITSPPYPNRVSAIRELRPYMYWLDYIKAPHQAGLLDWEAIGGTWGVATHRLSEWVLPVGSYVPPMIRAAADRIAAIRVSSAPRMANYVLRYFADMWLHIEALARVMRPEATLQYVVGNASFYGHLVETEKAFVRMFTQAGFEDVRARALRKRSSKAELFEFVVEGRRP